MNVSAKRGRAMLLALAAIPFVACSGDGPRTALAKSRRESNPAPTQASASGDVQVTGAALRLALAPTGNTARYRVRERLVGRDLPNDAIGETTKLSGSIAFDSNGRVIRQASKFTVDAASFVSDKNRRDGYVRGRLLEADEYPQVVLVPTEVRGVTLPLPTSGSRPIEMLADLTVHGVTRPTVWKGTAQFGNGQVTGSAATAFTFDDIQMEQPRVPVLLSVADTIRLEIGFNLVKQ
ncbi:MAG: YceI family protein [Gemmatimonadaceae bacterium]